MHTIRNRLTFANVLAVIAVFIALGGTVYAANKISGELIKPNSLPGNRLKNDSVTAHKIKLSTLPKQAPRLWAVVDQNGHLVRGAGVTSTTHLFLPGTKGSYQVIFNRDITNCALSATLGRTDAANLDPAAGEIGVAYRNGNSHGLYVKTRDSSGVDVDASFHAAALC